MHIPCCADIFLGHGLGLTLTGLLHVLHILLAAPGGQQVLATCPGQRPVARAGAAVRDRANIHPGGLLVSYVSHRVKQCSSTRAGPASNPQLGQDQMYSLWRCAPRFACWISSSEFLLRSVRMVHAHMSQIGDQTTDLRAPALVCRRCAVLQLVLRQELRRGFWHCALACWHCVKQQQQEEVLSLCRRRCCTLSVHS